MVDLPNNSDYSQARQTLQHILQQPQFQAKPPATPWWMRLLNWLASHLHVSISKTSWLAVSWSLVILVLLGVLFMVGWWVRSMKRNASGYIPLPTLRGIPEAVVWLQAQQALQTGDHPQLLHALVEVSLRFAADCGWAELRRSQTLRGYVRSLRRTAEPAFSGCFQRLAEAAEAVHFQQKMLTDREARQLYTDIEAVLQGGRSV